MKLYAKQLSVNNDPTLCFSYPLLNLPLPHNAPLEHTVPMQEYEIPQPLPTADAETEVQDDPKRPRWVTLYNIMCFILY